MNSNNTIRNYKHDISGKFKDISTALASMDENAFDDTENNEIFHAVHEVLLKMVKTSRNTMLENLKQEIVLVVSDQAPDTKLAKLQIEGVAVRYEIKNEKVNYYLYLSENAGDVFFSLGRIYSILPVKGLNLELKSGELRSSLEQFEALKQ